MKQKTKDTHAHVSVSELLGDPNMEKEIIENFEEYIFDMMENREWISNTGAFIAAIQDFYFNGNVSLGLKSNITKVSLTGRIKLCCVNDKIFL